MQSKPRKPLSACRVFKIKVNLIEVQVAMLTPCVKYSSKRSSEWLPKMVLKPHPENEHLQSSPSPFPCWTTTLLTLSTIQQCFCCLTAQSLGDTTDENDAEAPQEWRTARAEVTDGRRDGRLQKLQVTEITLKPFSWPAVVFYSSDFPYQRDGRQQVHELCY